MIQISSHATSLNYHELTLQQQSEIIDKLIILNKNHSIEDFVKYVNKYHGRRERIQTDEFYWDTNKNEFSPRQSNTKIQHNY